MLQEDYQYPRDDDIATTSAAAGVVNPNIITSDEINSDTEDPSSHPLEIPKEQKQNKREPHKKTKVKRLPCDECGKLFKNSCKLRIYHVNCEFSDKLTSFSIFTQIQQLWHIIRQRVTEEYGLTHVISVTSGFSQ